MLGNNGKSLILTRDPESQNCIKHIDIIHHHIQRLVEDGELEIKWISSSWMLTDSLTKALLADSFKKHWNKWGLEE